jgi:hypothetical protein
MPDRGCRQREKVDPSILIDIIGSMIIGSMPSAAIA